MGEVEKKQKKREKEPKDNRNLYLAREEIQACFTINHHTMVSISGTASAEGVSARRKVLEKQK